MLSGIVPPKSHVSCSTMPDLRAQLLAPHAGDVDPVEGDASLVDLVEAHEEVDQRGLAGTRRPDDRHGLAGRRPAKSLDERLVGEVGERYVLERHLAPDDGQRSASAASGSCSVASRSAKTRSAEATPDWSMLAMLATWVSGWLNWREYWMKACTSPSESWPEATWRPPTTATKT